MLKSEIYHPFSNSKKALLVLNRTGENTVFDKHNPVGVKHLNWLRRNFSHLNEYKFCLNFRDTVKLLRLCNTKSETVNHYLLCCLY